MGETDLEAMALSPRLATAIVCFGVVAMALTAEGSEISDQDSSSAVEAKWAWVSSPKTLASKLRKAAKKVAKISKGHFVKVPPGMTIQQVLKKQALRKALLQRKAKASQKAGEAKNKAKRGLRRTKMRLSGVEDKKRQLRRKIEGLKQVMIKGNQQADASRPVKRIQRFLTVVEKAKGKMKKAEQKLHNVKKFIRTDKRQKKRRKKVLKLAKRRALKRKVSTRIRKIHSIVAKVGKGLKGVSKTTRKLA